MYPYFTWKNISSLDKNIMVNKLPDFERPPANIEKIVIPGRDGFLTQDDGTYQGIVKTCECSLDNGNIDDVCAWLTGSGEVIFSNEPDKKYKATIINKIPFSKIIPTFHSFIIQFDCQPHKYSTANALTTLIDFANANLVANGSFETDLSGWTVEGTNTFSVSNAYAFVGSKSCKQTATGCDSYRSIAGTPSGHKVYFTGWVYIVSPGNGTNLFLSDYGSRSNTISISADSAKLNQWQRVSVIKTLTSDGVRVWFGMYGAGLASEVYYDGLMAIDLDTTFGADIPTQAWCDTNITFDSHSGVILNPGTTTAKPIIKVYGTGTIDLTITTQGKNLFDGILAVNGYNGSNGAIAASPTWRHSVNRVIIEPNTTYTLSHVGTETRYIFGYDASDVFINFTDSGTYTTASNCKYMRICFDGSGMTNIQLEEGIVATAYEKYISNSTAIILTNVVDYVVIDSQLMDAYKGTILKNNDMSGNFPTLTVGTNTMNWAGTVTKVEITPNFRYL